MKNFRSLLILGLSAVFLFASCNKEDEEDKKTPVACFTYTVYDSEVSFNSGCSQHASSYLWEFGINVTSIAKNPTIDFGSAGSYQVTLQVSGPNGQDTHEKTVTIEQVCVDCYCWDEWGGGYLGDFCGTSQQVSTWCNMNCSLGPDYTCSCN